MNSRMTARALEQFAHLHHAFFKQVISESRKQHVSLCTDAQLRTLHVLGKKENWRMSDLSRRLRVSNGSLTIMINRLIDDGLVERDRSSSDRRVVTVKLSEKGKEFIESQWQIILGLMAEYIDRIPKEEQENLHKSVETCVRFLRDALQIK